MSSPITRKIIIKKKTAVVVVPPAVVEEAVSAIEEPIAPMNIAIAPKRTVRPITYTALNLYKSLSSYIDKAYDEMKDNIDMKKSIIKCIHAYMRQHHNIIQFINDIYNLSSDKVIRAKINLITMKLFNDAYMFVRMDRINFTVFYFYSALQWEYETSYKAGIRYVFSSSSISFDKNYISDARQDAICSMIIPDYNN